MWCVNAAHIHEHERKKKQTFSWLTSWSLTLTAILMNDRPLFSSSLPGRLLISLRVFAPFFHCRQNFLYIHHHLRYTVIFATRRSCSDTTIQQKPKINTHTLTHTHATHWSLDVSCSEQTKQAKKRRTISKHKCKILICCSQTPSKWQ